MSLSWRKNSREELYEKHVNDMLDLWRGRFRNTYLPTLSRMLQLDRDYIDDLVEVAIILHDVGKLYVGYQRALRGERADISRAEYRHEIVSASLTPFVLPAGEERYVSGGAILLHHEPILMGQVSRYAEPYLTITDIERRLRKACGEWVEFEPEGIEWTCRILQNYPFSCYLPERMNVDDILERIKDLMLMLCVKGSPDRRATMRLKVSSMGALLSIIDSKVANENRGPSDDGGTFITRRARRAEVCFLWA